MNLGILAKIEAIVNVCDKGCHPQLILNMLLAR
jgi:hypothetical protein